MHARTEFSSSVCRLGRPVKRRIESMFKFWSEIAFVTLDNCLAVIILPKIVTMYLPLPWRPTQLVYLSSLTVVKRTFTLNSEHLNKTSFKICPDAALSDILNNIPSDSV